MSVVQCVCDVVHHEVSITLLSLLLVSTGDGSLLDGRALKLLLGHIIVIPYQ